MTAAERPDAPEVSGAPARRVFSTAALPPEQRLRGWEEYNESALFGLNASSLAPEGLLAQEANLDLGRVHLAEIGGNTHVIERTPRRISSRPVDTVMMCLLMQGDAFIYHSGGFEQIRSGDAVLYDSDSPFLYGFTGRNHQVIIEVPRSIFQGRIAADGVPVPRVLRHGDDPATAQWSQRATHLVRAALRAPAGIATDAEEQLLSLQAMLVDPRAAGADGHVLAAQEFIRTHLAEADLSAPRVAAAAGVSERHLRRLFADTGETLAHYVVEQRLRRARELLVATDRPRSVAEVALAVGYVSPAHFSRAFRAHFGQTPSDVRAAAA